MANKDIVVDGSNVAYEELTRDGKPKTSNLVAADKTLRREGYDPIIIIDASLRHEVDDPQQLEALIDRQSVRQAPAGTDADFFVLETAARQGAAVLSNDRYSDFRDRFPWLKDKRRRIRFMVIEGELQLYEPAEE